MPVKEIKCTLSIDCMTAVEVFDLGRVRQSDKSVMAADLGVLVRDPFVRADAVEVLQNDIADAALDEVRIWFPDPWPKSRHAKRRLVSRDFDQAEALQEHVGSVGVDAGNALRLMP